MRSEPCHRLWARSEAPRKAPVSGWLKDWVKD